MTTWDVKDDLIVSGNNGYEFRLDATGDFGEVVFRSTNNRYRMTPVD